MTHTLQTNGILLNEAWAAFFAEENFLIGLSLDGPAHLHNQYRVNRAGKGTHAQTMAAMALLKAHKVEFNTLTVVGKHNVDHAREVYDFAGGGFPLYSVYPAGGADKHQRVQPVETGDAGESAATLAPRTVPARSTASSLIRFLMSGFVVT